MVFCSSAAGEEAVDEPFLASMRANRKAQEERYQRTGKAEKWLAVSSDPEEPRRCIVRAGKTFFHTVADGNECPAAAGAGVNTYRIDGDFRDRVAAFQAKHAEYSVTFLNSGPHRCLAYCAKDDGLPCVLEAATGEKLQCEDEDKWDLVRG